MSKHIWLYDLTNITNTTNAWVIFVAGKGTLWKANLKSIVLFCIKRPQINV